MVLIVNPKNITTGKTNFKVIQGANLKNAPKPTHKMSKEKTKAIQGEGFKELSDKLKGMKLKDLTEDIRITM
jgi:hypothetical protein|tara:strand:+ start:2065 stop:2280 length:216 start_codon:yes stop_codon:yes gene_type:complete